MKKFISFVLAASIMTLGLSACKSDEPVETVTCLADESSVTTESESSELTSETTGESAETTMDNTSDEWVVSNSIEITDDLGDLFSRAVDNLVGVGYTPVYYLGYIQSGGTIHCFLCESVVIVPDAIPYWSLVYVFEDAEGNAAVTGMYVPEYNPSDAVVMTQDLPTDLVPGGWSAVFDIDLYVDMNSLIDGESSYTMCMPLASQVVAGTNYAILCQVEDSEGLSWSIVYVYQDLNGTQEVIGTSTLDLGSVYGPLVWNGPGEDYRDVCRAYLEENDVASLDTIIDIDNPGVAMIPALPDSYAVVTEGEGEAPYYSYCYQTTQDGLLGPIIFIVDSNGTILGLGYRE